VHRELAGKFGELHIPLRALRDRVLLPEIMRERYAIADLPLRTTLATIAQHARHVRAVPACPTIHRAAAHDLVRFVTPRTALPPSDQFSLPQPATASRRREYTRTYRNPSRQLCCASAEGAAAMRNNVMGIRYFMTFLTLFVLIISY
jgi:hypothetical protein